MFQPDALHTNPYFHLSSACFQHLVYIFYNVAMDTIDVKYQSIKVFRSHYTNVISDHNMGQEGYWFLNPDYYTEGFPCTSSYPMLNHVSDHLHHPKYPYSDKKWNGNDQFHDHTIAYYRSQY